MNDISSNHRTAHLLNIILLLILAGLGFINAVLIMLHDFNSDKLALTALYNAIIVERLGFNGWNFSAAPQFFPDIPLFFITKSLSSNIFFSNALYVLLLLAFIVFLCIKLFNMLTVPRLESYEYGCIAILALSSLLSFPNNQVVERLWPNFHGGEIVLGFASLVLSAHIITRRVYTKVTFILQLILSILLIASDKLIISQFFIPIMASLFITTIIGL
ncbi:MAG: hypothetical protein HQK93_05535, partial [Nitrospirae bacterium]|nr:hypothetical protein [Nitrospirota bacterium]